MKESEFVERNKAKWQEFERELDQQKGNPERISHFYVETVDDLSFARTHYPNRLVRSYLNGLAERLSLEVQKSQKNYGRNFVKFWKIDLPLIMYEARNQFLISFLLLAFSIAVGVFSSMHDPTFASYILGQEYIDITLENIESGDPMAIYKDENRTDMFMGITLNNIMVSVRTFILSLFAGAGTLIVIIYNGVMIGVFQYFFVERGLFAESFLTIWQHGIIEISCIVLAGAAGLVLAKGILFPKTYSRLNAFRIAGRKSLIIMLGIMPLLVYSGAIEAFLTRYTDIHWSVRLISILITLGFVIVYFVIYPRKLARQLDWKESFQSYLTPITYSKFEYGNIEKNTAIVWETFRVIGQTWKKTIWWIGGMLAILTGTALYLSNIESIYLLEYANLFTFHSGESDYIIYFNFIVISSAFVLAQRILYLSAKKVGAAHIPWKKSLLKIIGLSLVVSSVFSLLSSQGALTLLAIFLMPALGFLLTLSCTPQTGVWKNLGKWISVSYGKLILMTIGLVVVAIAANTLRELIFISILLDVSGNFLDTSEYFTVVNLLCYFLPSVTLNFLLYLVIFTGYGLKYHGVKEALTANSLRTRIEDKFPSQEEKLEKANLLSNKRLKTT